jgi:acyl phosphate:glycerol-3-phosphate acyltransferase
MNLWLLTMLCSAIAYVVGSIPFSLLLGKLKGVDIRKVGSGNVGAMNLGRLLGRPWFIAAFILDMLKGLFPTVLAGWLLSEEASVGERSESIRSLCWLLSGMCAVLGHNYPVFLGFRGGKGVSTSLGVALGVYPDLTLPAILSFIVWVLGLALTRMSSVGSICGAILFPVFCILLAWRQGAALMDRWPFLLFALVVAVLVVGRHRANIARILAGTETRVVRSPSQPTSAPDTTPR